MRTTLSIDDALDRALMGLAHRSNKPFKQAVNETLRSSLRMTAARPGTRYALEGLCLTSLSC